LTFDIAGLELFLPLVTGSRVVVVSREVSRDGEQLGLALLRHAATVMQATPSTWRMLLDASPLPPGPPLVLCGGETLPPDLARRLLDLGGTVCNLYGPTETTIWSTLSPITAVDGPLSIGKPIANTQIYLLDRNLSPVPIGVRGEVYIAGEGLARGYAKSPDLTAERFLPHPWASLAGERLYRTGDLARSRSDGTLEYLGRSDTQQVKLRGYRIELGEIEATLHRHPAVREAAVVLRDEHPTGKYLAAYVVIQHQMQATQQDLQGFLREHLPDYMVPTIFTYLERLPLSPNGKVARAALPVPQRTARSQEGYVAPQSELEQHLSHIWQEVLDKAPIGIHDNFFDLGGHSLLLMQVRSKLQVSLGYEVSVVDLFRYPTIRVLSAYLSGQLQQPSRHQTTTRRVHQRKTALQNYKRSRERKEQ